MIKKAEKRDISQIAKIYENARSYMRSYGNTSQWVNGYPSVDDVEKDIENQNLYVLTENNNIYGVFVMMTTEEPTYHIIVSGQWNDDSEYFTLHRVASSGEKKDVFSEIIEYTKQFTNHIRIDTHRDNFPMQKAILRNDFSYCGIIYLKNGDERLAYEWVNKKR